jgi:glycosyltransferase involved in cell wall biosynthesis
MTHYRVPFFENLRAQLELRNLELVLAYGEGTAEERRKNDGAEVSWGRKLTTRYFSGGRICYQPLKGLCNDAAMLIVTPENKLICNLWHQFARMPYKIGLWGHGANLQGRVESWREKFKSRVARRADWWFAYTELSRSLIARTGFPEARVTVVNNSVDTRRMRAQFEAVDATAVDQWRRAQGIGSERIGIFLGSLYEEKRIDFLLKSAIEVRARVPDFEIVVAGAGPQRAFVESFCSANPWAHYVGMLKGMDKVTALASATVMLNPGLVGLGILDSFVCEVPLLTTDCGIHSPEIAYLQSGVDGVMTANTLPDYVQGVVSLLEDSKRRDRLKAGCKASAMEYTVENMARNFAEGVGQCLNDDGPHPGSRP